MSTTHKTRDSLAAEHLSPVDDESLTGWSAEADLDFDLVTASELEKVKASTIPCSQEGNEPLAKSRGYSQQKSLSGHVLLQNGNCGDDRGGTFYLGVNSQQECPLFCLPLELRSIILNYLQPPCECQIPSLRVMSTEPCDLSKRDFLATTCRRTALLLTCKRTYNEYKPVLYGNTVFVGRIGNVLDLAKYFGNDIGQSPLRHLHVTDAHRPWPMHLTDAFSNLETMALDLLYDPEELQSEEVEEMMEEFRKRQNFRFRELRGNFLPESTVIKARYTASGTPVEPEIWLDAPSPS